MKGAQRQPRARRCLFMFGLYSGRVSGLIAARAGSVATAGSARACLVVWAAARADGGIRGAVREPLHRERRGVPAARAERRSGPAGVGGLEGRAGRRRRRALQRHALSGQWLPQEPRLGGIAWLEIRT
ncbi:hypothetical protein AOLI_G00102830 [Acnodon oligacanthus]